MAVVNFVIYSVIMTGYNLKILGIFLLGSGVYAVWVILFLRRRRKLDYMRFQESASNQSNVVQLISGMQDIKLNNCEKQKRWDWEQIQVNLYQIRIKGLVLGQTQQVGGAFIDQTKNVLISFIASFRDPRIIVIDNPYNTGHYVARNRGHAIARGKYICAMDSDDIAHPERLEEQFAFMENNPGIGISGSNCRLMPRDVISRLPLGCEEIKVGFITAPRVFYHPTLIMRKSLLDKFDLRYSEEYIFAGDGDLFMRGSKYFPVANIEKPLLTYFSHATNITNRHGRIQLFLAKIISARYISSVLKVPVSGEDDCLDLPLPDSPLARDGLAGIILLLKCFSNDPATDNIAAASGNGWKNTTTTASLRQDTAFSNLSTKIVRGSCTGLQE